jgi:hypothetical protein
MILNIRKSPVANKRYRVDVMTRDGTKQFDFGQERGYTYIDGATEEARANYWRRHTANALEDRLIRNLTPSPAVLSAYLLWGQSRDLVKNIQILNRLWRE